MFNFLAHWKWERKKVFLCSDVCSHVHGILSTNSNRTWKESFNFLTNNCSVHHNCLYIQTCTHKKNFHYPDIQSEKLFMFVSIKACTSWIYIDKNIFWQWANSSLLYATNKKKRSLSMEHCSVWFAEALKEVRQKKITLNELVIWIKPTHQ